MDRTEAQDASCRLVVFAALDTVPPRLKANDTATLAGLADKGKLIRVPVHMTETMRKVSQTAAELYKELGRKPEPHEIADAMEVPLDTVHRVSRSIGK